MQVFSSTVPEHHVIKMCKWRRYEVTSLFSLFSTQWLRSTPVPLNLQINPKFTKYGLDKPQNTSRREIFLLCLQSKPHHTTHSQCNTKSHWTATYNKLKLSISSFRRVVNVASFLLSDSSASEFYVPTFRNTLFKLHRLFTWPMKCSRKVGTQNSDAGKSPKRKNTTNSLCCDANY